MNRALRSALVGPRFVAPIWPMPVSFFHSTTVLERIRRNRSHSRFNYYAKQKRKTESKSTLIRNLSDYAEYLIQSWQEEDEQDSYERPWFRRHFWVKGAKKNASCEPQWESWKGTFEFRWSDDDDDDDDEVETIFHSAFGGERFSYWSFNSSRDFRWCSSGHTYHKSSRNWTYETDDESDVSAQPEFISERYRTCALKWRPDRHQGLQGSSRGEVKALQCSIQDTV